MKTLIGIDISGKTDKPVYAIRRTDGTLEVLSDNEAVKLEALQYIERYYNQKVDKTFDYNKKP
jgi:hypothetical protein